MSTETDARKLRIDDQQARDDFTRAEEGDDGTAPTLVGTTATDGSYPTTANAFYAMVTGHLSGTEVENGPGTVTGQGDKWYAYNLGTAIPPQATNVIATYIPYRWVFRYDG